MRTVTRLCFALLTLTSLSPLSEIASASQTASKWYFGSWSCTIDGRPARMRWRVVDDPQTTCAGGICTSTSGVKVVGHFSDNGGPWTPLRATSSGPATLNMQYLGAEQAPWFLRYNAAQRQAQGWTTWRGHRYPLSCSGPTR